ncbi:hypothetical protein [Pararhizobium sp. LjRoot238]
MMTTIRRCSSLPDIDRERSSNLLTWMRFAASWKTIAITGERLFHRCRE